MGYFVFRFCLFILFVCLSLFLFSRICFICLVCPVSAVLSCVSCLILVCLLWCCVVCLFCWGCIVDTLPYLPSVYIREAQKKRCMLSLCIFYNGRFLVRDSVHGGLMTCCWVLAGICAAHTVGLKSPHVNDLSRVSNLCALWRVCMYVCMYV